MKTADGQTYVLDSGQELKFGDGTTEQEVLAVLIDRLNRKKQSEPSTWGANATWAVVRLENAVYCLNRKPEEIKQIGGIL